MDFCKLTKKIIPEEHFEDFFNFVNFKDDRFTILFISGQNCGKTTITDAIADFHKSKHIYLPLCMDCSCRCPCKYVSGNRLIGSVPEILGREDAILFSNFANKLLEKKPIFRMVICVQDHDLVEVMVNNLLIKSFKHIRLESFPSQGSLRNV